jgi:hypothetical protein
MSHKVPLIVDADQNFLDSCLADPRSKTNPPLVASTGKDAQLLLCDNKLDVLAVFVNPNVSDAQGISVIRCAHLQRPGTSIYLLLDKPDPVFDSSRIRQLGIQRVLEKPVTYLDIAKLVLPTTQLFEAAE